MIKVYKTPIQTIMKVINFMLYDKIKDFFRQLLNRIVNVIRGAFAATPQPSTWEDMLKPQLQEQWKSEQVKMIIENINADDISNQVYEMTEDFIQDVHMKEQWKLMETKDIYEAYKNIDERNKIDGITKSLAEMNVRLQCIVSQFQIRFVSLKEPIERPCGTSGQGTLQMTEINNGKERVIMKQLAESFTLSNCSFALSIVMNMQHPNIQPLIGIHLHNSTFNKSTHLRLFSAIRKQNCRKYLDKESPSILSRVNVAKQVALALMFMHARGVYHRNLKLENVLTAHDGRALLSDFNFSTLLNVTSTQDAHEIVDIQQFGKFLYDLVSCNSALEETERKEKPKDADHRLWCLIQSLLESKEENLPPMMTIYKELSSWTDDAKPSPACEENQSAECEDITCV